MLSNFTVKCADLLPFELTWWIPSMPILTHCSRRHLCPSQISQLLIIALELFASSFSFSLSPLHLSSIVQPTFTCLALTGMYSFFYPTLTLLMSLHRPRYIFFNTISFFIQPARRPVIVSWTYLPHMIPYLPVLSVFLNDLLPSVGFYVWHVPLLTFF